MIIKGQAKCMWTRKREGGTARSLWKWMKRRAAIEPGIGHLKAEHRLERNRLWGEQGDMVNAILSAAGMNFRKLLRRAAAFCRAWMAAIEVFEILMGFRRTPQMKGQFA